MSLHVGWPQAIVVAMLLLTDAFAIANHGKVRSVRSNGWVSVTFTALWMAVLYWGGFFS